MMMRVRVRTALRVVAVAVAGTALLLVAGCGGKKKKAGGGASPSASAGAGAGGAGGAAAMPARKVNDTGPLWALAPEGATFGFVVADGVLGRVHGDLRAVIDLAASHPVGKQLVDKMMAQMQKDAPFNVLDAGALTKAGIDLKAGVALFGTVVEDGVDKKQRNVVAVLPVGDRAAFRTLSKARQVTEAGVEFDVLGDKDDDDPGFCAPAGGRYICAGSPAAWTAASKGGPAGGGPLARAATSVPASARGDVEFHIDLTKLPAKNAEKLARVAPVVRDLTAFRATAVVEASGYSFTWHLAGKPGPMAGLASSVPAPKAFKLGGALSGVMRMHVDPDLLMMRLPPDVPPPLRSGLFEQLEGDFAFVSGPGASSASLLVAVKDAKEVLAAVRLMCTGAAAKGMQVDKTGTGCVVKLPGMMVPGFDKVEARAADGLLALTMGKLPAAGDASALAGSPEARAALSGPATFSAWGRGFDLAGTLPAGAMGMMKMLMPRDVAAALDFASTLGLAMYEYAATAVMADDGVHLTFRITTFGGDPPAAQAAYKAAIALRIKGDDAGYKAALAAAEKAHPGTLVARQAALVREGYMALGPGTGVLSAVAIPAFMKYLKKSKRAAAMGPGGP